MENVIHSYGLSTENLFTQIRQILNEARTKVATTVNTAMVAAYWHIGTLIVEAQGGETKAKYGDGLINELSAKLTKEFGRGFKRSNLRDMRQLYLTFPIYQTLSGKLSWSHYLTLMRVANPKTRISVFAPKYKLMLPTEEELPREIERTKENFKRLKG